MGGENKVFSLTEVAQHSTSEDCWLIIDGKVYDVTKFLEDHPGGDEVLLTATGRDSTEDFEDIGHSKSARDMLTEMYVGDIDKSTMPKNNKETPPKQTNYNSNKTAESNRIIWLLVPLLILGLAFFYMKSA